VSRLGPTRTSLQSGHTPLSIALADVEHPGPAEADLGGNLIIRSCWPGAGRSPAVGVPLVPPPAAGACPQASCHQPGPILLALKSTRARSIKRWWLSS
jgi:hypothetical protein